jgi:hypothetical protein
VGTFLCVVAVLALAGPLRAGICYPDSPPAATLLLPYFEVDLDRALGRTTLFSLNNASAAAVLTNVTLWTDLGVPTLRFNVYLTGFDVQTVNLRDIFNGVLPATATVGQDPSDVISPKGDWSQDINFASCLGTLPNPPLQTGIRDHLRLAHTGRASPLFAGKCAGQFLGAQVARGYVTVDTVSRCDMKSPVDAGYFSEEWEAVATNQNVLWGDFFLVDEDNNFAQGENLVRIEADPRAFSAGSETFYGRYVGHSGADGREPLPSTWATRFVDQGTFSGGTDLIVWRDSGGNGQPFSCGVPPARFPLRANGWAIFDEQEQGVADTGPVFEVPPFFNTVTWFPAESNRVKVGTSLFQQPFDFGWLYLDLREPTQAWYQRVFRQSWVGTLISANGRFAVGYSATPLDTGCAPIESLAPGEGF